MFQNLQSLHKQVTSGRQKQAKYLVISDQYVRLEVFGLNYLNQIMHNKEINFEIYLEDIVLHKQYPGKTLILNPILCCECGHRGTVKVLQREVVP